MALKIVFESNALIEVSQFCDIIYSRINRSILRLLFFYLSFSKEVCDFLFARATIKISNRASFDFLDSVKINPFDLNRIA